MTESLTSLILTAISGRGISLQITIDERSEYTGAANDQKVGKHKTEYLRDISFPKSILPGSKSRKPSH